MNQIRLKIVIRGAVQGVGFRPTVYRLASGMCLCGWVRNTTQGLILEVEGEEKVCHLFVQELRQKRPAQARIISFEVSRLDPKGYREFEILDSNEGDPDTLILPDIAMCDDCRKELFNPKDRRYRYPFTNCTQCGPRYSIVQSLPYDRHNTTMKDFTMCPDCQKEYDDPNNRRFHAQPNACPVCGPYAELWDAEGEVVSSHDQAIKDTAQKISEGKIVALKGLGGFQLIADAQNQAAVERLRERKRRGGKPFAVMFPFVDDVKASCHVSAKEEELLASAESPIVLLKQKDNKIAKNVAPENPYLGVMLPYTPLHSIILNDLKISIVATSGNLSEEPMCIDEQDALKRLNAIADYFLVHNRPIQRAVDDSVTRIVLDRELIFRRARGYAPLPFVSSIKFDKKILAVGGHLKNTIAISKGNNIFLSQHIGDLETEASYEAFERTIDDISKMYNIDAEQIVCDEHPNYLSTKYAQKKGLPLAKVQHHYAHIFSCMAENDLDDDVLGVSWDGTGFGLDESVWGGEFILVEGKQARRVASFRQFPLPGAEKAVQEPRRTALGFLYQREGSKIFESDTFGLKKHFSDQEWVNLKIMLEGKVNSPMTSSVGRLFDVVAAVLDVRQVLEFEGQAAMQVEFLAEKVQTDEYFEFDVKESSAGVMEIDLPLINALQSEASREKACARFHNTLAESIISVAKRAGKKKVAMSGGCFQNRYLLELCVARLEQEGFQPYWHQRVPPNDGGICLGQIVGALRHWDTRH